MLYQLLENLLWKRLFLVLVFLGVSFLTGSIARAQFVSSQVTLCYALCSNPNERGGRCPSYFATCSENGTNNCTCTCFSDNLSDGECSTECDYPPGNSYDSYCYLE